MAAKNCKTIRLPVHPEVQAALSVQMRDLLALDDPHNDAMSAQNVRRSGFMK